ncbi:MAG TPA: outer membrane beta-barrel protein [Nitrospiria bacterium]|nr:outer membrane beta-barrel protein [Nitrospiria bacterium]
MLPRALRPWCSCLLALSSLGWTVSDALAGPQPGETELIVSGGGQHDGAQISLFGVELIPKPGQLERTGVVASLTLDHQFTTHLGLEVDGGYTPRLGEPQAASVTTATAGLVYSVNPAHDNVLYLVLGGGAAWFNAADGGIANDVTGAGVAAIGADVYLNQRLMLRVDFRLFYVPSPFADQDLLQRATIGVGARF